MSNVIEAEPLVSVLMPVHNAEGFLADAITSVLSQTYRNWELIVIDDGSTDRSLHVAQELARAEPRVRVLQNAQNLGIVKTRNRAFEVASAQSVYFAIMDGDDICMPERLKLQVAFLQAHPDYALVAGNTRIIDEQGVEIGRRDYPSSYDEIMAVITRYNPIAQPSAMIRRTALDEVGCYDERYPRCQDYDLWLRLADRFKIANLAIDTLKYRISETQGKRVKLRDSLRFTLKIQRPWLFRPRFFRAFNVLYWCAQHALLLLPEPFVLGLFKYVTYRKLARS